MTSEQNDHPNLRYNYAKEQAATKAVDIYIWHKQSTVDPPTIGYKWPQSTETTKAVDTNDMAANGAYPPPPFEIVRIGILQRNVNVVLMPKFCQIFNQKVVFSAPPARSISFHWNLKHGIIEGLAGVGGGGVSDGRVNFRTRDL
jgi:hypothetical protein